MGTFDNISVNFRDPAVLAAMTAVGLTVVWLTMRSRKDKMPPGPRGWPLIGNILDFNQKGKLAFQVLAEMGKKFGGVFSISVGTRKNVIITKSSIAREALVTKQNDFAGRPSYYSADLFSGGGKDIVSGDFGEVWKLQRKLVHGAIRKFLQGEKLEEKIRESVDNMMEELKGQKDPFDPLTHITLLMYNIISNTLFGKQWRFDDPKFQELKQDIEDVTEAFGSGLPGDFIPILKYIPTQRERKLKKLLDKIFTFFRALYSEHQATHDPDSETDIVYHLIGMKKEAEREGDSALCLLDDEHMFQILNDFFFAGTDTTRYTLHWVIAHLAAYPEVQKKAREEVDSLADPTTPVTLGMRSSLPYIEAVYHEVLRIYPIGALTMGHKTTCDTTLEGYELPKGTEVMVNLWALHHDPEEWDDPEAFRPQRFLDENGKMIPKPSSYMPFSAGRRVCVGETLAKAEIHYILALLLQRFTFEVPEGEKLVMELVENDFQIMCKPYKILMKPRF